MVVHRTIKLINSILMKEFMRLVLTESRFLKDSISVISELINEVTIKVGKNALELVAMDPANVAMVTFKLLSSSFAEYSVPKEVDLGLNLEGFKEILRRVKPTDTLILELSDKGRLNIQVNGENTRTFHLSLIDVDEGDKRMPDLKFSTRIEIPTTLFDEAIEDMSIVADSVALTAENNKFTLQAESKLNSAKVEMTSSDSIIIKSDKEKVLAKYSLEYLKKIVKGSKLADNVVLYFDDEYPLKAEYKIKDRLELSFILAPRISTE